MVRGLGPAGGWDRSSVKRHLVIAAVLVLATAAVYARVGSFEFIDYDDPSYLWENDRVSEGLTWSGLGWARTTGHAGYWHPLTWGSRTCSTPRSSARPRGGIT